MSDLQTRFDQAQIDVKTLSERPNNMTLLRLYALYKQGAEGDAHGDKPGMTDFVAATSSRPGKPSRAPAARKRCRSTSNS
jgi:acyl-CoA-binding protein